MEEKKIFRKLKKLLITTLVLTIPNNSYKFWIKIGVSKYS